MQLEPKNGPVKNVLLADDDIDDRFFFAEAMEEMPSGPVLTAVSNGEQLMDYLNANVDRLPDVMFLDLNMPRKNGFECLAEIKANKHLSQVPVIIYSTSLINTVADQLYQKGAHYYIQKDITDLTKLLEYIFNLLENNAYQRPTREAFVIKFIPA